MKKLMSTFSKKCILPFACIFLITSQSIYAQASPTAVISALNSIRASIDSIVNLAGSLIFQPPQNIGNELVSNNAQNTAIKTVPTTVKSLNDQDILSGIAPNTQNPNQSLIQMATIQASDTILPSATLGGLPIPFYSSAMQSNLQNALAQGNENFNFQSLVTPLAYNSQDLQTHALNYIRFVSGWASPISTINLSAIPDSQLGIKQKLAIQNSASFQTYTVQRRQVVAMQSALLTNLYAIYSRRLPVQTLKASDTGLGVATPSVAQIEDYNATWRTSSPTWYTQMSTASPANVQREILFVLAEMQVELHRIHQDNERLLALTAVGQIRDIQAAKQTLGITEKQVQDTINQQLNQNAQQGTSGAAPGTGSTTQQSTTQQTQSQKIQRIEQSAEQQAQQKLNQAEGQ